MPFRRRIIADTLLLMFLFTASFFAAFPASSTAQEVIHFSDAQLETAVRQALGQPAGVLTTADLIRLETLDASRRNITDLSGLEYALNLRYLNLYENEVEDLSSLAGLTRLKILDLTNNCISNISALQALTALEELDLSYNNIRTIDALNHLTRMRSLHLEGNDISNLAPLASMRKLESLFLSGNLSDSNVTPLSQLTRLQRLMLADGHISDIAFLKNLKQLQWLELRNNQINNLEPLKGLTKLEWLSLANNQAEDVAHLGGLRQLRYLDLNNNRVRELTPLVRLRNLEWVELQNNFLELQEGTQARRDVDNLLAKNVEVITRPQKLPLYRGNGLVTAKAGSGGKLLRTPANLYFTLLNYHTGWRIKSFTAVHEGGKPLDRLRELGHRTLPARNISWYSLSVNNRVDDKEREFYTATFSQPGPVQLGLAVQIWPGYAGDPERSFYIARIVLENMETGDLYAIELDRDPLQSNLENSGIGGSQPQDDYQPKAATAQAELEQILTEALQQRVSSLEVRYTGEALQMPVETILDNILARDDYLNYSLSSSKITSQPGGSLLLNFRFNYLATREEENIVDQQVKRILREILTPGMDDHQKTKAVHDYVVAHVAYDLSYHGYSAYAALVKGRAVCQGYALLMYKMLEEAGVEVRIIQGRAGGENHAWNMVNLGGIWYHLDATWNDPVPDSPGMVRYDYYNRTDAQMAATHTWDRTLYPAANTTYPTGW